ncbi:hypothetical protein PGQ11_000410 [Apiospora arundinis]
MGPFKSHSDLAAELLKSAKTRNIEVALPIATRWVPRAALAAGEALARANGGGPNPFEKHILGPAETILVGAPPEGDAANAATASTTLLAAAPGGAIQWATGRGGGSSSRAMCGLCRVKEGREDRVLGEAGMLGPYRRKRFLGGPVEPDVANAIELLLGASGNDQSFTERAASVRGRSGWW